MENENTSLEKLVDNVGDIYKGRGLEGEFNQEKAVYKILLDRLVKDLDSKNYKLDTCIGLGSTASIWIVNEKGLHQKRVLKISRPRLGRLKDIIKVIRGERDRLALLNHENIVKIYAVGEVSDITINDDEYEFPYFIMEHLEGVQDLGDYNLTTSDALDRICEIFQGVLSGLSYLHSMDIVHCDIKPANILIAPGRPPLVTDFGYSKHLLRTPNDLGTTDVTFTKEFAHPELIEAIKVSTDPNAAISIINRDKLRPAFDLYSLGMTLRHILSQYISRSETSYDSQEKFDNYQRLYLSLVSKRLLDGIVKNVEGDELLSDHIPGLPSNICKEVAYKSANEALEDVQKLMNLYNLEGEIPELNPHIQNYIQIPGCQVPLSARVKAIISHESFLRLANVTQLGFVSLIYPGASHTRYEHVLGTFARCCEYIKSLWYDQTSPMFRSLMTKGDIELALLSSLLHDIAQYPMAHDLAEVSSNFEHEKFTGMLLHQSASDDRPSMSEIVQLYWNVDTNDLLEVLTKKEGHSFKNRIIRSLVNGPLDCDKVDYIKRDSTHLGVPFGSGFDADRLIRNLVLAYRTERDIDTNTDIISALGIGVSEKALAVAGGLWKARREMFTQVYWHHSVRALKAMLGYIVRQTLMTLETTNKEISQRFWEEFYTIVAGPSGYKQYKSQKVGSFAKEDYLDFTGDSIENHLASQLAIGDEAILMFFEKYAPVNAKTVVEKIKQRRLFSRHTVISKSREKDKFSEIYQRFRTQRLDGNIKAIEDMREKWETAIKRSIKEALERAKEPGKLVNSVVTCEPLLLVDVPLKATSRGESDVDLLYLPEEHIQRGYSVHMMYPKYTSTPTILGEKSFDEQVGKIRVFIDPDLKDVMERAIGQGDVRKILYEQ